jgi:hypothetical protein
MTLVQLREFLLSQPGATEDTPFGPEILYLTISSMPAIPHTQTQE